MHTLLVVLVVISSIVLIVSVMLQPSKTQGLGLLTGIQETFYTRNKTKTRESMLVKLTVISGTVFALSALFLNLVK